jgi:glycosyltransferase involved in cell wall biosynthesis
VTPDASTVLVVVPAYNEAECIAAVVTSVRAQGYPCVVVDDASTDTTAALAAKAGATVLPLPINLAVTVVAFFFLERFRADGGEQAVPEWHQRRGESRVLRDEPGRLAHRNHLGGARRGVIGPPAQRRRTRRP